MSMGSLAGGAQRVICYLHFRKLASSLQTHDACSTPLNVRQHSRRIIKCSTAPLRSARKQAVYAAAALGVDQNESSTQGIIEHACSTFLSMITTFHTVVLKLPKKLVCTMSMILESTQVPRSWSCRTRRTA